MLFLGYFLHNTLFTACNAINNHVSCAALLQYEAQKMQELMVLQPE
jgi:hypothetical protein